MDHDSLSGNNSRGLYADDESSCSRTIGTGLFRKGRRDLKDGTDEFRRHCPSRNLSGKISILHMAISTLSDFNDVKYPVLCFEWGIVLSGGNGDWHTAMAAFGLISMLSVEK